jgi:hypothetical protein
MVTIWAAGGGGQQGDWHALVSLAGRGARFARRRAMPLELVVEREAAHGLHHFISLVHITIGSRSALRA